MHQRGAGSGQSPPGGPGRCLSKDTLKGTACESRLPRQTGRGHTGHQLPPTPSGGVHFLARSGWGPPQEQQWHLALSSTLTSGLCGLGQDRHRANIPELRSACPTAPGLPEHPGWVGRLSPLQALHPSEGGNGTVPSVHLLWKVESTELWDLTTGRQERQGQGFGGPSRDGVVASAGGARAPSPVHPSPSPVFVAGTRGPPSPTSTKHMTPGTPDFSQAPRQRSRLPAPSLGSKLLRSPPPGVPGKEGRGPAARPTPRRTSLASSGELGGADASLWGCLREDRRGNAGSESLQASGASLRPTSQG